MEYITNYKRSDGFGAQFQSVLWTLLWAEHTGKMLIYTDITDIDLITTSGSIKDTVDENTLEEVVDYMGFNKYCINRKDIPNDIPTPHFITAYKYVERHIDSIFKSPSFKKYKDFFYQNKVNRFNREYLNIAVHIRKMGNFERENNRFRSGTHDMADTYYLNLINTLRNKYSDKKVMFHIYSQGSMDMFTNFVHTDTVFHLNEKILDTFTDLIMADVLLTCRSSFSYMAALLSNNEIHYLSFWHPPLNTWNVYTDNSKISIDKSKSSSLRQLLLKNGVKFDSNSKIIIPPYVKRIKFDVGIAIEAIHTEDWLNKNPDDLLVFGFEALPFCVQETRKYFSQPITKWKNVHRKPFLQNSVIQEKWLDNQFVIVPAGLADKNDNNMNFHVTNKNVGCSSILKPSQELANIGIRLENIINVPLYRLSDFFELLPLDTIDHIEYVKVDVQGTDLDVVKSGGKYISEKVVFLTIEAETTQYENAEGNSLKYMIEYMKSIGFLYIKHPNTLDATFLNKKFQHLAESIYISQFN